MFIRSDVSHRRNRPRSKNSWLNSKRLIGRSTASGYLETLEALDKESDGTASHASHQAIQSLAAVNVTLNRLPHDEDSLLRSTGTNRYAIAADILGAIKKFEQAR